MRVQFSPPPDRDDDAYERRLQREIRQLRTAVRSLSELALLSADELRREDADLESTAQRLESVSLSTRSRHLGEDDRPDDIARLLDRLRNGHGALAQFSRPVKIQG